MRIVRKARRSLPTGDPLFTTRRTCAMRLPQSACSHEVYNAMSAETTQLIKHLSRQHIAPMRPLRILLSIPLALFALAPLVVCIATCVNVSLTQDPLIGVAFSVVCTAVLLGWLGFSRLRRWLDKRRQRASLQRALAQALRDAGFDHDAQDPGAIAIREAFWKRQQRDALTDLRVRIATHKPPEDLLVALWRAGVDNKVTVGLLALIWFGLTGIVALIVFQNGLNFNGISHVLTVNDVLGCMATSGCTFAFGIFYLLSVTGLGNFIRQHSEQRELVRETHRVVNLIETAGGLSLAEHEVRDLLQGALSDAAVVGGEVELVAQEVRFDDPDVALDLDAAPQEAQEQAQAHRRAPGEDRGEGA
jgi:hypothetical protein